MTIITAARRAARTEAEAHHSVKPAYLSLEGKAPEAIRRHLLRKFVRTSVLVAGDVMAFSIVRAGLLSVAMNGGESSLGVVASNASLVFLRDFRFGVALILGLTIAGSYGPGDRRKDVGRLLLGVGLAGVLSVWHSIGVEPPGVVTLQLAFALLAFFPAIAVGRQVLDILVASTRPLGAHPEHVVFVGDQDGESAAALRAWQVGSPNVAVVGWVSETHGGTNGKRERTLGKPREMARVLATYSADTIVLCSPLPPAALESVIEAADSAGCRLISFVGLDRAIPYHSALVWHRGVPFVELVVPLAKARRMMVKRGIDLLLAGLGLLALMPLFAILALLIRLDSRGPAFFRQQRIGKGGRPFQLLKFRTMYDGVSEAVHRQYVGQMLSADEPLPKGQTGDGKAIYKLIQDDRVTRVGRWLRRTSIDELPQLINVLRGEMSLVGPRPPLPYECERYESWQFERLRARPGITGLWQVSGRNLLTYRQMCELDIQYVRRWSLWLDLRILLRTAPVVLFNIGQAS